MFSASLSFSFINTEFTHVWTEFDRKLDDKRTKMAEINDKKVGRNGTKIKLLFTYLMSNCRNLQNPIGCQAD